MVGGTKTLTSGILLQYLRPRLWLILVALLLFLLAFYLRANQATLMEFKHDEAVAWWRAQAMLQGIELPTSGLMSSKGLPNFPLFLYIIAFFSMIFRQPAMLVYPIASLNSLAVFLILYAGRKLVNTRVAYVTAFLYSVSPCAVFLSRKIWAQDLLPFWSSAMLAAAASCLSARMERTRYWGSVIFAVMTVTSFQIHLSALFILSAYALVLLIYRKSFSPLGLIAGGFAGLIPAIPYCFDSDVHAAFTGFLSQIQANASSFHPKDLINYFVRQISDGGFPGYLGRDYQAFLRSVGLYNAVRYVLSASVVLGLLLWCWSAIRNRMPKEGRALLILTFVPLGLFFLSRIPLVPSYFASLYPLPFLFASIFLCPRWERISCFLPRSIAPVSALMLVAGVSFLQISYINKFLEVVKETGGAHGDYGITYQAKEDSARWLSQASRSPESMHWVDLSYLAPFYAGFPRFAYSNKVTKPAPKQETLEQIYFLSRVAYPSVEMEYKPQVLHTAKAVSILALPRDTAAEFFYEYPDQELTELQSREERQTRLLALSLLQQVSNPHGE